MNNCIKKILSKYGIEYYATVKGVMVFLVPYKPYIYDRNCYTIDGYYSVSNSAYNVTNKIINELRFLGIEASAYKGNMLRSLCIESGLASLMASGFVACKNYGTYIFIGAIFADIEIEPSLPEGAECSGCGRCKAACPTGALDGNPDICLRAIQITIRKGLSNEQGVHLNKLKDRLLGCDICQRVCRANAAIAPVPAPERLSSILNKNNIEAALADSDNIKYLADEIGVNIAVKNRLLEIVKILQEYDKEDD